MKQTMPIGFVAFCLLQWLPLAADEPKVLRKERREIERLSFEADSLIIF